MNERLRPWLVISRRTISSSAAGVFEDRLDGRLGLAGAHQIGRRAGAEQEADGLDEDRLARARLAGQDVEAGLELDLDGLDHREVADAEEAQHVGGTPIVSYL